MSWSEIIMRRVKDLVESTQVSAELVNYLFSKRVITREQRDTLLINYTTNTSKATFLYNNIAEQLTAAKVVHFKGALRESLCDRALEILEEEEKKEKTGEGGEDTNSDVTDSKDNYASGEKFALIINVLTDRNGAEKDGRDLHDTLFGCGFKISICHKWKKEEIKTAIAEFKEKLQAEGSKRIGAVLIVVASHGKPGDFFGLSNKELLSLDVDVIDQFNGANCKVLDGVPKVFLVNMCRGPMRDIPAVERKSGDNMETYDSFVSSFEALWESRTGGEYDGESRGTLPTWWDLLVAYSTYDGRKSIRYPTGTVFLQAFCEVVRTEAKGKPVCIKKLLEKVSEKIKQDRSQLSVKQGPSIKHTGFTKSLPIQYL